MKMGDSDTKKQKNEVQAEKRETEILETNIRMLKKKQNLVRLIKHREGPSPKRRKLESENYVSVTLKPL